MEKCYNLTQVIKKVALATFFAGASVFATGQTLKIEAESYTGMLGLQSEACSDAGGGTDYGWSDPNDWLSYTVNVPSTGYYKVEYRIAGQSSKGELALKLGQQELASTAIPPTGGWQIWQTVSTYANLTQGSQVYTLFFKSAGFNINWWQITRLDDAGDVSAPTAPTNIKASTSDVSLSFSWTASTDNVAVLGYNIYKDGAKIGTTTSTSYTILALIADTDYAIEVEAFDTKSNLSVKALINAHTNLAPTLVWSDEFDTAGLPDPTKWSYDSPYSGDGNQELQYYTSGQTKNSRVENGTLIIEAHKEVVGGRNYTSARLVTQQKGSWLYGKVEVRAKLPIGGGTWPAIWMLPTDWAYGDWPDSGEIDIMEHIGNDAGNVHASTHSKDRNFKIPAGNPTAAQKLTNVDTEFHLYALQWYPDRIEMYYDNIMMFSYSNPNIGWTSWPFDKRFHLILNVAVGGSWGGVVNDAAMPQRMTVDYVRVYDLHLPADTEIPSTPKNLTVKALPSSATITWDASIDNYGVASYDIYDGIKLVQNVTSSSAFINGLTPQTAYSFSVVAKDAAGNVSSSSDISFSTPAIVPIDVPAKLEAENFIGMSGIQTQTTTDTGGGENVGYIDGGDWMEYSINVTQAGSFNIDFRAASTLSTGVLQIIDETSAVLATVALPSTSGWQTWQTFSSTEFNLKKGVHTLRMKCAASGYNLNWFKVNLKKLDTSLFNGNRNASFSISISPNPALDILNIATSYSNESRCQIVDLKGQVCLDIKSPNGEFENLDVSKLAQGFYLVEISNSLGSVSTKFVKE